MSTYGHATPEEQQHIQELEARIDAATSPLGEILELALLYIEPCHRGESVVELLQAILQRDPNNSVAKIWIGYCCLWALISPEWQRYAQGLLQEALASEPDPELVAGAYLLLAQLSRKLAFPKWNEPEALSREIELLRVSIDRAPHWVNNHRTLAWAYKQRGDVAESIEHLQRGIENMLPRDPELDPLTLYFESYITGRIAQTRFLHEQLQVLQAQVREDETRRP